MSSNDGWRDNRSAPRMSTSSKTSIGSSFLFVSVNKCRQWEEVVALEYFISPPWAASVGVRFLSVPLGREWVSRGARRRSDQVLLDGTSCPVHRSLPVDLRVEWRWRGRTVKTLRVPSPTPSMAHHWRHLPLLPRVATFITKPPRRLGFLYYLQVRMPFALLLTLSTLTRHLAASVNHPWLWCSRIKAVHTLQEWWQLKKIVKLYQMVWSCHSAWKGQE